MNIQLDILELNHLYYATSKLVEHCKQDLKEYGTCKSTKEYLTKELNKAEALCEKIQTALWDEVREIDEAIEYVNNMAEAQLADRVSGDLW